MAIENGNNVAIYQLLSFNIDILSYYKELLDKNIIKGIIVIEKYYEKYYNEHCITLYEQLIDIRSKHDIKCSFDICNDEYIYI